MTMVEKFKQLRSDIIVNNMVAKTSENLYELLHQSLVDNSKKELSLYGTYKNAKGYVTVEKNQITLAAFNKLKKRASLFGNSVTTIDLHDEGNEYIMYVMSHNFEKALVKHM